jgi:hypothetical protein
MKISEELSNSKTMVFNVKKLLNDGVDLMLQQREGEKQSQQTEDAEDLGH